MDLVQASAFDANYWTDLRSAPLLAIDELGAEPANVQSQALMFDLLNRRIESERPTLIATNLDGPAFALKYLTGPMERLADRLKNFGRWVEFTAPSMRQHWQETQP
jgi:DNA replication protein DnaC